MNAFTVSEDPYYCGLSARVPKFDRAIIPLKKSNKQQQSGLAVPKRMSIAYLQHPLVFAAPGNAYQYPVKQQQYTKQKQLLMPRQNYQQMMWHARSMESGLGKLNAIHLSTRQIDFNDFNDLHI